jgi:hypothetical protein
MSKIKQKSCRICHSKYTPWRPLQSCCSRECKLDKLKTKQEYLKDAQRHFNIYIRLRDGALPCISCQRHHSGQYHAGHYRTIGSSPGQRFNEDNVHKQCSACNNYLSGNIVNYRINLIDKIGISKVEALEADNEPKHYTIEEVKQIKIKYKQLTRKLQDESTHT